MFNQFHNSNTSPKLDVFVDPDSLNIINDVKNELVNCSPLNVHEFLAQLQQQNLASNIFIALNMFLGMLEGRSTKSYKDSEGNMTIGVGFNLNQSGAEAVIYEADPNLDFNLISTQADQPKGGLSPEQINNILYYALVGVKNEKGTFFGKTESLVNIFKNNNIDNIKFRSEELITMQSLAYNTPSLVGPQICAALKAYSQSHDPLGVILQITECSNKLYKDPANQLDAIAATNGIQGRRDKEAQLFLKDNYKIHIPYRQYKRVEEAQASINVKVVPQYGIPIYSLPYQEKENSYPGNNEKSVISSGCADTNIYYGSDKADEYQLTDTNPIVLSGKGEDVLKVPKNVNSNYPYLAGGEDYDRYEIDERGGEVMISDSDGKGMMSLVKDNAKIPLAGIAQFVNATGSEQNFSLTSNNQKFNLKRTNYEQYKASETIIKWSNSDNAIRLPNFKGGQLDLALAYTPQTLPLGSSSMVILPDGLASVVGDENRFFVYIQNFNGELINFYQILTPYEIHEGEFYISEATSSGLFTISWMSDTEKKQLAYRVICSKDGLFSPPQIISPNFDVTIQSVHTLQNGEFVYFFEVDEFIDTSGNDDIPPPPDTYLYAMINNMYVKIAHLESSAFEYNFSYCGSVNNSGFSILLTGEDKNGNRLTPELVILNYFGQIINVIADSTMLSATTVGLNDGYLLFYMTYVAGVRTVCSKKFSIETGWSGPIALTNLVDISLIKATALNDNRILLSSMYYDSRAKLYNTWISLVNGQGMTIADPFFTSGMLMMLQAVSSGDAMLLHHQGGGYTCTKIESYGCRNDLTKEKSNLHTPIETDYFQPEQPVSSSVSVSSSALPVKIARTAKNILSSMTSALTYFINEPKPFAQPAGSTYTFTQPCYGEMLDGKEQLRCEGSDYQTLVFPKGSDGTGLIPANLGSEPLSVHQDHYDVNTCKPIEYKERPSVYCEGENTTLVYSPVLPQKPFEQLDANISLLAVAVHQGLSLFKSKEKEQPSPLLTPLQYQEKLALCAAALQSLKNLENKPVYFSLSIDELFDDFNHLKRQGFATKKEIYQLIHAIDRVKVHIKHEMNSYDDVKPMIRANTSHTFFSRKNNLSLFTSSKPSPSSPSSQLVTRPKLQGIGR